MNIRQPTDYFSGHARQYAAFRPTYPESLFEFLSSLVQVRHVAWDCGTGNGQVAYRLAQDFDKVYATDISPEQLSQAPPHPRVIYQVSPAECTSLPGNTCNLVTAAAAVHWFQLDGFYGEIHRVAAPECLVALWAYDRVFVNDTIDQSVTTLYRDVVGPYWPAERAHVERRYEDIRFPFRLIRSPEFTIEQEWSSEQFLSYLETWSSVQLFLQTHHRNPVDHVADAIRTSWGSGTRPVRWPVIMKLGRLD